MLISNRRVYLAAALAAFWVVMCFPNAAAMSNLIDTTVAVVGESTITAGEVIKRARRILAEQHRPLTRDDKTALVALSFRDILNNKLILAEAKKAGIEVSTASVNARIHNLTKPSLAEYLEKHDLDYDELSAREEEYLMRNGIIRRKFSGRIHASPREIREFYKANISRYSRSEMINCQAITIFNYADPEKNTEAREKAQRALDEIKGGADFAGVARRYSEDPRRAAEGGNWGWIDRDAHQAAKLAFELELDTVSEVIETEDAFWILLIKGKTRAETDPVEKVWNEIADEIRDTKFRELYTEWTLKLADDAEINYTRALKELFSSTSFVELR
ncbi:MAG: peptidylprolyl isomerase [Thermoplasmata archaeon]|nr:peptidylprolyl isomerase [Thermoplasmata archaeon]